MARLEATSKSPCKMPNEGQPLAELKLRIAIFLQQLFASDKTWNDAQLEYQQLAAFLSNRRRLQPFARRYRKNPVRLCERGLGPNWFEALTVPKYQQPLLSAIFSKATEFLGSPELPTDTDAKQMVRYLRRLVAGSPGRKPAKKFQRALELREQKKTFHQICKLLNPAYAQMSSAERRNERERWRSGVTRLEQKTAKKTARVTK